MNEKMKHGQGRPNGVRANRPTCVIRRTVVRWSVARAARRGGPTLLICLFLASFLVTWADEPEAPRPRNMFGILGESLVRTVSDVKEASSDDSIDLRVRIAWGGGSDRAWQGTCRVTPGSLVAATCLGREPDDPGSLVVANEQLKILQTRSRSYSGIDVHVRGSRESQLVIELAPRDRPNAIKRMSSSLGDLLQQSQSLELDDQRNRLIATRSPGDRLRVKFDQDHLVFAPGAEFKFEVEPHWTGFEAGTTLRFRTQVLKARSDEELWKNEVDLRVGDDGILPQPEPTVVRLPTVEGVYDIKLSLTPRRLPGALSLGLSRDSVQRTVQVAVVDEQSAAVERTPWRVLAEIDPTHGPLGDGPTAKWTDWLKRLPQLKWTTGFTQGPLGNGHATRYDHHGKSLLQLGPEGWQAYPLPIQKTDEPHQLEIEYPSDLAQTLSISIVEPNAAGKVVPIGVDSGLDVVDPPPGEATRMLKHRLTFWPRTKMPLVLLVNRRTDRPAVFGKLSVLAGPVHLPPAPQFGRALPGNEQRLIAAFFDRPIFPENFGAGKALDASGEGTWDDWATFLEGGRRFVEYLKYAGYNAAVVTVACEGSSLYPSRLLEPTPKYDSGVFLTNGADPVRKDVLEMLLRLFDREGLVLIPAIQFATPLPELERLRREGGEETAGMDLIGPDGSSWVTRHDSNHGLAPYYNPLHPQVRRAMSAVVGEIEERYSHHESFGGLSLQLGPDTYMQMPGESWGIDDATIERFGAEARVRVPGLGPMKYTQRSEYLLGDARSKWLEWRSRELSVTHRQLQETLARRNPKLKLYLATADVLTSGPVQSQMRPALPNRPQLENALLGVGLDPGLYRDESVVLLRPQRSAPLVTLASQGANLEMQRSTTADRLFAAEGISGVHWYHESLPLALPSFDAVSPFGPENTHTWLVTHATPGGPASRMRLAHSLASSDVQVMFDGGWMLPLGAEEDVRSIYEVYRHLPRQRFQTAASGDSSHSQPLVVRSLSLGQQTYLYVVNDSPWNVSGQIELRSTTDFRASALGSATQPNVERTVDGWRWKVRLNPYDVQAVLLTAPRVTVASWQVTPDQQLNAQLAQRVQDIRTRANRLRSPQPYDVLRNPGFESAAKDNVPHWLHAQGSGIQVQLDPQSAHSGQHSLKLKSDQGVVWLRSTPFPTPSTGRLAVWVWLKVNTPEAQPPLRLAIEGRLDGRTYYRFATVGGGKSASPLSTQWTQYWFQIDDLPTNGLTDLRVGFDLMGAGEVWLDDVQIFDLWFYDNERDDLIKNIGLADFNLSSGQLADCQRFLEGYWPRFLKQHVPRESMLVRNPTANRPAIGPTGTTPPSSVDSNAGTPLGPTLEEGAAEKTSWKNRMNNIWPKKMRQ